MRYPAKLALTMLLAASLGSTGAAHGAIEDNLTAPDDPKQNLLRLVQVLRQLQANDLSSGDLAQTTSTLDTQLQRLRVLTTLRTLLPDVVRHHALRERRSFTNVMRTRKKSQIDRPPSSLPSVPTLNWLSTGDQFESAFDLWIQAFADDASQDDADGLGGFDSSGHGLAVGLDHTINDFWSVGINIGRSRSDVTTDIFGDDEIDSIEYGASLSYSLDAHTLMFSVTQQEANIDRLRNIIVFTGTGPRLFGLASDIESEQTSVAVGYSGYFELDAGIAVAPFVSVSRAKLVTDDYIETGNGTMALSVATDDEIQIVGATGLTLSWDHLLGENWLLTPSIGVAFEHDFKADSTETLSRFRNTPLTFTTQGYGIEENRWRFSTGLGLFHRSEVAISIAYEGHRKGDYNYDAAIISLQVKL